MQLDVSSFCIDPNRNHYQNTVKYDMCSQTKLTYFEPPLALAFLIKIDLFDVRFDTVDEQ